MTVTAMSMEKPNAECFEAEAASFRWPAGKSRLAPIIVKYIPTRGRKFLDLFAGRGNLFFRAAAGGFDYGEWVVNDILTAPFFHALRSIGNQIEVPSCSKAEFLRQRELAKTGDQRAVLLEGYLVHNGGTFASAGWSTSGGCRTAQSYEANLKIGCRTMRDKNPRITAMDWLHCLEAEQLDERDFVYLDVPYIDCAVGPFNPDSVVHSELIEVLQRAKFKWLLSEFRQPVYVQAFGEPLYELPLHPKAGLNVPGDCRLECLWGNINKGRGVQLNVPYRFSEAVPLLAQRTDSYYDMLSTERLLEEINLCCKAITAQRNTTCSEFRRRLLPALIVLKSRVPKGMFYSTLAKMGLNPSTVRVWFYRGRVAEEVIGMLEQESESPAPEYPQREVELDERAYLIRQADKMAAAFLSGDAERGTRLASEYANARLIRKEHAEIVRKNTLWKPDTLVF